LPKDEEGSGGPRFFAEKNSVNSGASIPVQ
jgi:hypothetical protein